MPDTHHQRGARLGRTAGMRRFRLQLSLLIIVFTVSVFGGLYYQARRLLHDSLRAEASSYFKLIFQTRQWNADHGGVWVLKRDGVETNPYLLELGIPADIKSESGAELTLRNPAAMMSEISVATEAAIGITFHLTSDEPVNPANAPDAWERDALERLERREIEYAELVDNDFDPPVYRYIRPLSVDMSCLDCHSEQGYEEGDLRGAISINIPMDETRRQIDQIATMLSVLGVLTLGLALGASQYFVSRLEGRVEEANSQLEEMAVTDYLTGIPNRRATFERLRDEFARAKRTQAPLSVVALDVDHFKRVNDDYGHGVGDEVLREVSKRMQGTLREYDVFGRIGGEEFLVLAPDTEASDALQLAGRLIQHVRMEPVIVGDVALFITASAGSATMSSEDERPDDLIARADVALYDAKQSGRDRARSADMF